MKREEIRLHMGEAEEGECAYCGHSDCDGTPEKCPEAPEHFMLGSVLFSVAH